MKVRGPRVVADPATAKKSKGELFLNLKWFLRLGATLFAFSSLAVAGPVCAYPQLWFMPMDPVLRPVFHSGGSADFLGLFNPEAPWNHAAEYVSVFKLYPQFLSKASDDDLGLVVGDLKRRGIALGIETGILPPSAVCGHIEGYDAGLISEARRIKRLGGDVAYFVADEPLYFGHSFAGKEACRETLPELAAQAANSARAFREVFPKVKFLETEPIGNFREPDWVSLVATWHAEFAKAFGEPFSAFNLDMGWGGPWRERAAAIVARMRADHMPIGLICNGDRDDPTDQAWIDHARQRCEAFERVTGAPPDIVVFQSWVPRPTHVLPEDAPDSFTHLILEYARSHQLPPARPEGR